MRLQRRTTGFDDDVFDTMAPGVHRAMQQGLSLEKAMELAVPALHEALDGVAPRIAQDLVRRAPRMLRRHRRLNRGFERHFRKHWGKALDRFYAIVVCAEEVGHELHRGHREAAAEEDDPVFEALIGLYARACRIAREVHHLLSGGFPFGALARSRTLHELAVITIVIADYGREEEHADLADRFIQHAMIAHYTDAKQYQENCEALGREPLSAEDMARMEQEHDLLVERYGKTYKERYGWATGVDGRLSAPTFRDLEGLVDMSHLRWHYRQQSHEVHADATGWESNVLESGGRAYLTTDRVNFGLAEPAHLALVSLHQCAASLLAGIQGDFKTKDLLALKARRTWSMTQATFSSGSRKPCFELTSAVKSGYSDGGGVEPLVVRRRPRWSYESSRPLRLPPKAARTVAPPEGADPPLDQSREAHHSARPLLAPEGS